MAWGSHQVECGHLCTDALQNHPHVLPLLSALFLQSSRHHVGGEVICTLFSSAHKKYLYREYS